MRYTKPLATNTSWQSAIAHATLTAGVTVDTEVPAVLGEETRTVQAFADLWDWRRQVGNLYSEVRAAPGRPGWELWRAGRNRLFADHPQSPLGHEQRARFRGIRYFDYDPALCLHVGLTATPAARETVKVGVDGIISLMPFARTAGLELALGAELTLYWIEGYGGGVFLPFRDGTSGKSTYAGGRYLLDTIKGADLGRTDDDIILDFNFAYN